MTPSELVGKLGDSRLPDTMATLGFRDWCAFLALGLLLALLVSVLLQFLFERRPSIREQIRSLRDNTRERDPQKQLLKVAQLLGYMPKELRDAAYGAASPPNNEEIEKIALKAARSKKFSKGHEK